MSRPSSPTVVPYEIVFDGGAIGNPGKGYGSFVIRLGEIELARERREYGDRVTNNQAEYRTLIDALTALRALLGPDAATASVRIGGDSQLVINQVNGTWKVKKAELAPLRDAAREGMRAFAGVELTWHRRDRSVRELGH